MLAYTAAQTTEIERVLKLTELHLSPRHSTRGGCFAPVSYAVRFGPPALSAQRRRASGYGRKRPRGRLGVAVSDFRGVCVAPQREGPLAGLRSDFWRRGEAQSHRRRRGCRPRQVSQIGPVGSLDVRAVGHRAEWVEFTPAQVGTATSNAGGRDRGGHPPGPPLLSPSLDAAPQLAVEVDVEAHGQTERNCGLLRL